MIFMRNESIQINIDMTENITYIIIVHCGIHYKYTSIKLLLRIQKLV